MLDHFDEEAGRYIVMELIEGTDLGVVLKKRGDPGLPLSEALEYARQACEALQYVHEQQIVHRDVKPQNLIDSRQRGRARRLRRRPRARARRRRARSGSARRATWRPRCSPAATVSPRSDVFGIAATLWTLIAGKPPVYADPTKLTDICPDVPAGARARRSGPGSR